ncbi:MAG: hypothetical protein ABSE59_06705 [Opitutaceae bacterium]
MHTRYTIALIATIALLSPITVSAQLLNGDFSTGDFTGWTLFDTANGGIGNPAVVPFDTAGTGTLSNSAMFEVGQINGQIGGGIAQGGGIFQNVTLGSGILNISLNAATQAVSDINADDGTFELILDGNVVDTWASGPNLDNANQIFRSTLSYSGEINAGVHEVEIEMVRGYGTESGDTPYQYIDNVTLEVIPEPSAYAWPGESSRRHEQSPGDTEQIPYFIGLPTK